jgi:hypothetical protein
MPDENLCPLSFKHPPHDSCDGKPNAPQFGDAFTRRNAKKAKPTAQERRCPVCKMTKVDYDRERSDPLIIRWSLCGTCGSHPEQLRPTKS